VLESSDGAYSQTKTVHDDLIEGDSYIDLQFTGLSRELSYSLRIVPPSGTPYAIFEKIPYDKLNGYVGDGHG
jgi:hypothetical protein